MHKNNKEYTRVTEILSPYSGLANVDPDVLKRAGNRGTRVHRCCDAIIKDLGEWDVDEEIEGYINSFRYWYEGKTFLEHPGRWYCDDLMITGECDILMPNSRGLTLVDFKTSANEGKTWPIQGSAYSYLAKRYGHEITKIEFVKLMKNGKPAKVYEYEENFSLFMKCYDLYKMFFSKAKKIECVEF